MRLAQQPGLGAGPACACTATLLLLLLLVVAVAVVSVEHQPLQTINDGMTLCCQVPAGACPATSKCSRYTTCPVPCPLSSLPVTLLNTHGLLQLLQLLLHIPPQAAHTLRPLGTFCKSKQQPQGATIPLGKRLAPQLTQQGRQQLCPAHLLLLLLLLLTALLQLMV
jgi:hypothetical protein